MLLHITEQAVARIIELLQQQTGQNHEFDGALRISVNGGGCSGFYYQYEFINSNQIMNDDYVTEQGGVRIAVDSLSSQYMKGCTVDFITKLEGSYFEIKNPNTSGKCGCGNSFSV